MLKQQTKVGKYLYYVVSNDLEHKQSLQSLCTSSIVFFFFFRWYSVYTSTHLSVFITIYSRFDPGNDWLSSTATLPATPSLPGSCCQFHVHLLLHHPAHCADREVCADRIWEGSLPSARHLHGGSSHRHRLLYPFMHLGAKLTVVLCGKYSTKYVYKLPW